MKISSPKLTETWQDDFAPKKLARQMMSINTAAKAIDADTPSLANIRHEKGIVALEAYIKMWLAGFSLSVLGSEHKWSREQIEEMAMLIANENTYLSLRISELHLIFKRAKMGDYGEMYGRPSIPKVMGWFKKYWKERDAVALEMAQSAHIQAKSKRSTLELSKVAQAAQRFGGMLGGLREVATKAKELEK